ncbi:hypothetical protein HMPREF1551_00953 [Capnocytophaga sp. oral taxon 863 str. F0517]|nr:hypothetical protein HMPREF1551_00953 [Capnocytophaga sp. oral taxon 863 str. F0517]
MVKVFHPLQSLIIKRINFNKSHYYKLLKFNPVNLLEYKNQPLKILNTC